jgi:aminopeptidase I
MTNVEDKAWQAMLGSKSYMMGVSPWFYTNLPQWQKNWIWRGDSLWHERWQEVLEVQPEFVEIITWNDYGESHYIGPIRSGGIPTGAQRYVNNMTHDSWRSVLPYYIDAYKSSNSTPNISQDKLVFWYRINPSKAGSTGGTTGNNPDYQPVVDPSLVAQDKIFIDAIVTAPANVTVQIGSNSPTTVEATTAGVNFLVVPFNGQTGDSVTFKIIRDGSTVITATGNGILDNCEDGLVNYNAWVGES